MLTDDWRGAALHYMRERVRSLLAGCRTGSERTETHTLVSRRGVTLAAHLLYLPQRLQRSRVQQKAGQGWKWLHFVFSAGLYIESADRSGRGGGEADGRI